MQSSGTALHPFRLGLIVGLLAVFFVLLAIARYNFLLFHSLVEVVRFVVLISVALVGWLALRWTQKPFLVIVGASSAFVAVLEFLHAASYKGLNLFDGYDANLPTQLWIAFRFLEASSLLLAAFWPRERISIGRLLIVLGIATSALAATIFGRSFPDSFIEGQGLTPFKVFAEYVIIGLFGAAALGIYRRRQQFPPAFAQLVIASIVTGMIAELLFTLYTDVYGLSNQIGHFFILVSAVLLFRAFVETGIAQPLALVFNELTKSKEQLEHRVAERTEELASQRRRLQDILTGTNVGTWEWEIQTGATRFNARWAEIVGYTLEELAPISIDTWVKLAHPDDLAKSNELLQRHFAGELPYYEFEARMRHKDGHWVWVLDRGKVVSWTEDGKPQLMSGTHQDISERKEAEQKIAGHRARLKTYLDTASDGVHILDRNGNVVEFSESFARMLGYRSEEAAHLNVADWDALIPRDKLIETLHGLLEQPRTFETRHRRKDGSVFDAEINARGIVIDGESYLYASSRDITARKQVESQLRLLASVFGNSLEGIMITNPQNEIVDVNPSFTRLTGYGRDDVLGKNPAMLASGRHDREFFQGMWSSLKAQGFWRGEVWNRRKDGSIYAEILSISVVRDALGDVQHYIGAFADISAQKQHEFELDRIANFDALTGVPNRRLLIDRMGQAIAAAKRSGLTLAVCYLDLDGFKPINDQFGHKAGDEVLVEITRRIQRELRGMDTIARIGGDEFVMLLAELPRAEESKVILERILATIGEPIPLDELTVTVSGSVGVALFPPDTGDADTLLRHADQAMYHAKEAGKNRFEFFDPTQVWEVSGAAVTMPDR